MGKFPIFFLLLAVGALAAALFGALHNQLSYTVGPTYFTGFKFEQFGMAEALPPRGAAALVGVQASWWMGVLVGLPAFAYGLFAVPRARSYLAAGLGGVFLVILLATFGALVGLTGGIAAEATGWLDAYLRWPETITRGDFFRAGFMHEASYIAGALGALAAFIPMRHARRIDLAQATTLQTESAHAT